MALSIDLRKRILKAYLNKEGTVDELADRFDVGRSSVSRIARLYRETGSVNPRQYRRGPKYRIDDRGLQVLKKLVEKEPDATLEELRDTYYKRTEIWVGCSTVFRALLRMNLTRKKNVSRQGA
jgi:transposase